MSVDVRVLGVGMIPFTKPGRSDPYDVMGAEAARRALADAGIGYDQIEQAYVGYVYGDSVSGQAALYRLGQTGIPVVNVNNNCATGSSALWLARQAVASGTSDCVLALGFEQMNPGALSSVFTDRPDALGQFNEARDEALGPGLEQVPTAARFFGGAGQAYIDEYGIDPATLAHISVKSRRHAANNPYAVFTAPTTVEEVLGVAAHLRAAHASPVLPAHVWRGRSRGLQPGVRRAARPRSRRTHQGAGDDDRPPADVRVRRHAQVGRLRHRPRGRRPRL